MTKRSISPKQISQAVANAGPLICIAVKNYKDVGNKIDEEF